MLFWRQQNQIFRAAVISVVVDVMNALSVKFFK